MCGFSLLDGGRATTDHSVSRLAVFEVSDAGVSSSGKSEKTIMTTRYHPPIDNVDTKILSALGRDLFPSAHSLAGTVSVSSSTVARHCGIHLK
jgi:hypothetical protein